MVASAALAYIGDGGVPLMAGIMVQFPNVHASPGSSPLLGQVDVANGGGLERGRRDGRDSSALSV